jgi:hypothetical protein
MELAQVAIPNDLLQNLIFPHTHVKTILAAGSACREWNQVSVFIKLYFECNCNYY